MKKVLLASTALILSAGIASAQGVELTGAAEMGVKDDGPEGLEFHHDIDVKFTMSGETDAGLSFGATIDLDEVSAGIDADANPSSVFISGDFGTLTMGDTDGAFDWAMDDIEIGGAIADDHTSHLGFSGNAGLDGSLDGQVARYEYSFGDFAFAISAELNDVAPVATVAGSNQDDIFGIGFTYDGDLGGVDLGVGIGYQEGGYDFPAALGGGEYDADIYGISVSADISDFTFMLNYSSLDGTGTVASTAAGTTVDWDHTGVGIGYSFDAVLVSLNYGEFDGTRAGVGFEASGWGFAANYDLGGGAEVQFGYGANDLEIGGVDQATDDTWSLGLAFSF